MTSSTPSPEREESGIVKRPPPRNYPMRPACRFGGTAPCVDDLCHNGAETLCGIDFFNDPDICQHGYIDGTCDQGCNGDDWDDWS